jgi:hypothetical protein
MGLARNKPVALHSRQCKRHCRLLYVGLNGQVFLRHRESIGEREIDRDMPGRNADAAKLFLETA